MALVHLYLWQNKGAYHQQVTAHEYVASAFAKVALLWRRRDAVPFQTQSVIGQRNGELIQQTLSATLTTVEATTHNKDQQKWSSVRATALLWTAKKFCAMRYAVKNRKLNITTFQRVRGTWSLSIVSCSFERGFILFTFYNSGRISNLVLGLFHMFLAGRNEGVNSTGN